MKKLLFPEEVKNYYLGLDIGTDSIGWAITDENYNILKAAGKSLWGIRLFKSGETAENRRLFRTARRRNDRRSQRIKLLQELFAEEISKVDLGFYHRMQESKYHPEDKEGNKNVLFAMKGFEDKNYHKKFPTIYHLRKYLIDSEKKEDIRLVYLAVHHILKNRGHFLFEGLNFDTLPPFDDVYTKLANYLWDEFSIDIRISDIQSIKNILTNSETNTNTKKKEIQMLLETNNEINVIFDMITGRKADLSKLFTDIESNDSKDLKFSFSDSGYDEKSKVLEDVLQERFILVEYAKSLYDWSILSEILADEKYISYAKVATFQEHKKDLAILKRIIKKYHPDEYKKTFADVTEKNNYCNYVNISKKNGKKQVLESKSKASQEDFCKFLNGILKEEHTEDNEYLYIYKKVQNKSILPKQKVKDNSVIPYQVHLSELKQILKNASKYYNFLNETDEKGISVKEKIISLMTFRIPYYVGPLNNYHEDKGGNSWIVKKNTDPIRPWNFDDVVDEDASAEKFIMRMTNKCTYLIGADVLPKNSILYSKYMVLNELNNLRINDERVDADIKKKIYNELFLNTIKVTGKRLKDYLVNSGVIEREDRLSGFDIDFKSSMKPYIQVSKILKEQYNEEIAEDIIRWKTLFSESEHIIRNKIKEQYGDIISDEKITELSKLKFSGWGRLSKEFLTEIYNVENDTGEVLNIINSLYEKSENLMELLSQKYQFTSNIEKYNLEQRTDTRELNYDSLVRDLYASPAIKRGIWQSILIINELTKVMNGGPQKIFLEVTRAEGEKVRTTSRKKSLESLYKSAKKDEKELLQKLGETEESALRSNRLFLYYSQLGKCMYSGESIDIENLYNTNLYDVDHIIPRSVIKDDSLNNTVLVKKQLNSHKGDKYPVPLEFQSQKEFWKMLLDRGFIKEEKYRRLTRTTELRPEELSGFIERQIVETSQTAKAVAETIKRVLPSTDLIYVKSGNVSDFRNQFDIIKVREINDFHHAKDAYLNIVVGNVWNTKFTSNPARYFQNKYKTEHYNVSKLYDRDVIRNGKIAWKAGETGSIKVVLETLDKNNILFTRHSYTNKGGYFDQMPLKKGKAQFPLKTSDKRLSDIEKYGGYAKISGAYFVYIEHTVKNKRIRSLEYFPVYLADKTNDEKEIKKFYETRTESPLLDPNILISKIKIDTLFEVNGFKMHISSRTGNQIIFKGAHQLVVSKESEKYIKKIVKFVTRQSKNKELKVNDFDGISSEKNLEIYNMLLNKLKNTLYKTWLSSQILTIEEKRECFSSIPTEEQCMVLIEMLNYFQCNSSAANLEKIQGPKNAGQIKLSNCVDKYESVKMINQSVTGLFYNEVDLKKL